MTRNLQETRAILNMLMDGFWSDKTEYLLQDVQAIEARIEDGITDFECEMEQLESKIAQLESKL